MASGIETLAGVKGHISISDSMACCAVSTRDQERSAGLAIVIDEAETILRMRGDVRGKSLNAVRQIVNEAGLARRPLLPEENYDASRWVPSAPPRAQGTKPSAGIDRSLSTCRSP